MNADRAEAAFWAAFLRNRNVDAGTAEDGAVPVAGGYAFFVKGTYYQVALAVGSARPLTADDLSVVEGFYGRRGAPVRLELREEVLERDRALLDASGYSAGESGLGLYEAAALAAAPDGAVHVRAVTDRAGWVRLVTRAFADGGAPEEASRRSAELSAAAAHGLFVAEIGGVAAGAAAVAVTNDIALLYSGAVLPQFRRRGVHRALLHARAAFGAARGARSIALKTPEDSAAGRSALRAGFERTAVLRRVLGPAAP